MGKRRKTSTLVKGWGSHLPAGLTRGEVGNVSLPMLSEGPIVAGPVVALTVGTLIFVFFGAVFFPAMQRPSSAATRGALLAALSVGLLCGLIGLWISHNWQRAVAMRQAQPEAAAKHLHNTVAAGRRFIAGILLLLGLSAPWHAFHTALPLGLVATLVWSIELLFGALKLPVMLAFMSGQSASLARVQRRSDRLFFAGIGLLGLLVCLPPLANASPGRFFIVLTQILSLLICPWIIPLLVTAHIHDRQDNRANTN